MMGKVAFLFPGQGSQYPGMGKETYDAFSCARLAFIEADETLGFPLSELCFQGPADALKLTQNTQPAILTVSVAILSILQERGFLPDYVAGHSLGEYSALVCSRSLSFRDAVRAVRKRGKYMQEAVPVDRGAMAAILGLDAKSVCEACVAASKAGIVAPANFNAPDQTVIAGEAEAVLCASEIAKAKGAKRIMPLPVSAPFHCDLMAPARERLAGDLEVLKFHDLAMPLITNVDAAEVLKGSVARDSLIRQVCKPVRWVESIQYLVGHGVDKFVEIGPGKVLCGLVKKIAPSVLTYSVEGIRGIEALASAVSGAKM
ncbi:MAG: ACP S-malonyltransferase [Acidobacteriota bacterium]